MANYVGTTVRVFMKNGDSVDGLILFVDNVILKLGQVTITQRGISSKREQLIVKASDIKDLSVVVQDTPKQEEAPKNGAVSTVSQDDDLLTPDTLMKRDQPAPSSKPVPQPNANAPRQAVPDNSQYKDPAIISMSSMPLPPPQPHPAPSYPMQSPQGQQMYPHPSFLAPHGAPPGVYPYPPNHPSMFQRPPPQHQQQPQQAPNGATLAPTLNGQPVPQQQQQAEEDYDDRNGSPSKSGRRNKKNGSVSPGRRSNVKKFDQAAFSKPVDQQTFTEDFDFVGNNARFNKQQVFAQMLEEANLSTAPTQSAVSNEDIPSPLFKTDNNVSVPAVTADKMKELGALLEAEGPNSYQVIENIARSLAQLSFRYIKGKESPKVAILVGVGSKGCCGIATARHLSNHNVNVFICRSRAYQLPEQHLFQRSVYRGTAGKEAHVGSLPVEPVDLIIDCLIGTGLRGAPNGPTLTLIQWANANGAPILSLDVPSGVNPTTGKTDGEYIHAHTTMTVALPKTGLTKEKAGQLYLADVGIPRSIFSKLGMNYTSPFSEFFVIKLNFV